LDEDMVIDWETLFYEHKRKLEEEEKKRQVRLELTEKMRNSWKLAKLCREFIRENSNTR
jgi:hypothetical protein